MFQKSNKKSGKLFAWRQIEFLDREKLSYLFFGGLTTVVSILVYTLFLVYFSMNELIANVISWVLSVSFAFVTNRLWVFHAQSKDKKGLVQQVVSFYGGRILTLVAEELILFVFITCLHFPGVGVKVFAQILVVILNYVISKRVVFRL